MNLKTKIILFSFAVLSIFSFQNNFALAGFGISPPSVTNKDLVPGSFYQQDVYLLQGVSDTAVNVEVTVDAGKINNWIKIENGNSFVIPKGTQKFPMKVSISVPTEAKFGQYKGTINIKTSPVGSPKDGVSVNVGANINVDLVVSSKEVSGFSVENFQISDIKKGFPISLSMRIKNVGNVENGPTKVSLTFFDQYHSQQVDQQEVLLTEKVKSFETKDIIVEFPNNLETGSYWADVRIYNNDEVIVDGKIVFAVLSEPVASEAVEKSNSSVWTYVLIAILFVLGVLFFKKKKIS